jgi:hypothetical protein
VLEHVRREEVLLADRVERGDECQSSQRDAAEEQEEAVVPGEVPPTAAPQPDPRLEEENER